MKIILLMSVLLLSLQSASKERVEIPSRLNSDVPFTQNGIFSEDLREYKTVIEVRKIEDGALNGVEYRIFYEYGSGVFSGADDGKLANKIGTDNDWNVSCKKEIIHDVSTCVIYKEDLWIALSGGGSPEISVGNNQYPGSSAFIRIDSAPAIQSPGGNEGAFSPAQSKNILSKLMSGKSVSTRYANWPYNANQDKQFNLNGFNEAYQFSQWAISRIKSSP